LKKHADFLNRELKKRGKKKNNSVRLFGNSRAKPRNLAERIQNKIRRKITSTVKQYSLRQTRISPLKKPQK
jgi:hypothetical protein